MALDQTQSGYRTQAKLSDALNAKRNKLREAERNRGLIPVGNTDPAKKFQQMTAQTPAPQPGTSVTYTPPGTQATFQPYNGEQVQPKTSTTAVPTPTPTVDTQKLSPQTGARQYARPQASSVDLYQKRIGEMRDQYSNLLNPSGEEQAQLENINRLREAAGLGISGLEGQGRGIPLDLVRGQQAKLGEQANIKLQSEEARLQNLQGARQQQIEALSSQLGFAQKDLENAISLTESEGGELKEFGDQLLRVAPDGSVTVLATKPSEGSKPLTVSPGQTVIDPVTGEVIFQAGDRPEALPAAIQEYMFAQSQGYGGSYNDFKQGGGGTSKLAVGTQQDIVNIQSANQVIDEILALAGPGGNLPGVGVFGGRVPQFLTGQNQQEVRAKLGLLRAAIVKANAGTSFTDGERALLEEYLPKPTDTDGMINTKLTNLQQFLQQKAQNIQQVAGVQQGQGSGQDDPLGIFGGGGQLGFRNDLNKSVNGSSAERIAAAIRQVESGGNYNARGGSGESGAYQFMPATWRGWATKYLGSANAPMTPQNQDKVAISHINTLLRQGYNPQQIALIWNGGEPVIKRGTNRFGVAYDSGAYANKVLSALNQYG